jgi:1,4-dihydroxy-6-naphthoate synthase
MKPTTPAITLAFSPDSDDIFMFWPLLHGKVDAEGLAFTHERADTETLNQRAARGDVDVIALSMARYAAIADTYLLLPHGASVGRGYGPIVVANQPASLASLRGKRIGVPGLRTTAYATLRLLLPEFDAMVLPISPYARAFEAVRAGEVDAALLIHEGRLTYEREGFAKVCDVGEAWHALTGLPLPLGGNAIRRGLGDALVAKVSRVCRASIAWSLAHRDEVMTALLSEESRADVKLDRAMLDRYLTMYANADTLEMPEDAREGVRELFRRARAAGLLEGTGEVEFAP